MIYLVLYDAFGYINRFEVAYDPDDIYSWCLYANMYDLYVLLMRDEKKFRKMVANPQNYKIINKQIVYIKEFGIV